MKCPSSRNEGIIIFFYSMNRCFCSRSKFYEDLKGRVYKYFKDNNIVSVSRDCHVCHMIVMR